MSVAARVDTVEVAASDAQTSQPWSELGLKEDEYDNIREILGRRPTSAELAMYSVMWSEHCSYKSSKVHFALWGENTTDEMREKLLVGIGENAGVVDIGDGWAVTFKVESHNHPSYVEPYQGAATGVGGIVRDIMSMGARPIAIMDPLRFGNLHHPDTLRVLPGIVAGVGGYGNCLGLPNIGGEVVFDDCYQGNPLVNALCVGAMRIEDIHLASAPRRRQQGGPVRRQDRRRRHRRRLGARLGDLRTRAARPSAPPSRSATRSPRRCSSSAASTSTRRRSSPAYRTSAAPGCPVPPASSRPTATAVCRSRSTWSRCATRRSGPRRSSCRSRRNG